MSYETPLSAMPEWPDNYIQKLKAHWITSAEQVIGICATADGISSLSKFLDTDEDELLELIENTRKNIAPEVLEELDRPVDIDDFGLGAHEPDNEE